MWVDKIGYSPTLSQQIGINIFIYTIHDNDIFTFDMPLENTLNILQIDYKLCSSVYSRIPYLTISLFAAAKTWQNFPWANMNFCYLF